MDRNDYYYDQLVNEAELDGTFDDVENALWNLAIDIGLSGVVSGGVITETSPQSMNVYASGPCRGYDQLGRRLYFGPQQTVDCSQDEDGNPTVPTTPGNSRYIMLKLEFARNLSDPRTDGNGATVYYERDEHFEINVVSGAESAGAPTPPTAPSDALLMCDILVDDTTTVVTNAMVDTTRRDDFLWTDADKIQVTAGAWTVLSTASTHVQDVLDDIDGFIINRDGSNKIEESLIPDGVARHLGGALDRWGTAYLTAADVNGALTLAGNVLATGAGQDLGNATYPFDAYLVAALVYTSLKPNTNNLALGDGTNSWYGYFQDAQFKGTVSFGASARVDSNLINDSAGDLGSSGERWGALWAASFDVSGNGKIAGNLDMDAGTVDNVNQLNIENGGGIDLASAESHSVAFNHHAMQPESAGGWAMTSDYWFTTGQEEELFLFLDIPHGIEITGFGCYWYQAADVAADLQAILQRRAWNGITWSDIGTALVIDAFGTTQTDTKTGLSHTVDRGSYTYRLMFTSATVGTSVQVRSCQINYDITNLKAAIVQS